MSVVYWVWYSGDGRYRDDGVVSVRITPSLTQCNLPLATSPSTSSHVYQSHDSKVGKKKGGTNMAVKRNTADCATKQKLLYIEVV